MAKVRTSGEFERPATYNTINKWAQGISDTYALGVLAEITGHVPARRSKYQTTEPFSLPRMLSWPPRAPG